MKKYLILCLCLLVLAVSEIKSDLDVQRVDCFPEAPYTFGQSVDDKCRQRNCIYQSSTRPGAPWCYFPQTNYGYTMTSSTKLEKGDRIYLTRLTKHLPPFPNSINDLVMDIEYINTKTLRVKIYDRYNQRYEVPLDLNDIHDPNNFSSDFQVTFENRASDSVFVFKIIRKSTDLVLFDTSIGAMVFNDQFLQIATNLPSGSNVYGFGENNHPHLSHDLNFKTWGMFARDEPNVAGEELSQYGVQPVYNVLEPDGNAHGAVLVNSNAMEYSFTPNPALILRSIGGIFDFYFFSGPTPESVAQQYTSLVGHPIMIPYFSLGFQLSRWEYKDLNDMKKIVQRNLDAGIPLDIQYADIEHFQNNMDFTISPDKFKDIPQFFQELKSKGMHVVPIVDPALVIDKSYKPYADGFRDDVYIKWPKNLSPDFSDTNSDIMIGYCWPNEKVAYPDFMNNRTEKWWIDAFYEYRKVNFSFDALWIDMNEPSVFDTNELKPWNWPDDKLPYWTLKCPYSKYDDPPYRTKAVYRYDQYQKPARLSQKTLCMVGLQDDGKYRHYDVHSLYGLKQSKITQKATRHATGKRSFVLSRSTFVGSGRYAGHWLGDNDSSFKDLHRSIIGMIEFGMFGITYTGADICGFTSESNEELCTRWQQVGAFYPYSRNHNVWKTKDQDPAVWSQESIKSTIAALNIRYTILPYFYTLFYKSHTNGNLVIRGLFQEFPQDKLCRTIDTQFLVGPAWLVSPVVEANKRKVDVYFPPDSKWYSYYDGSLAPQGFATLNAPINFINLHVRGGSILPTQKPANNTSFSRKNPFGLIIALDEYDNAQGDLFYDDGDSIDSIEKSKYYFSRFIYNNNQLKMIVSQNNYAEMENLKLDTIRILGFGKISGKMEAEIKIFNSRQNPIVLNLTDLNVNQNGELSLSNLGLKMTQDFEINFKTVLIPEVIDIFDESLRVDCFPDSGATQSKCESGRKCKWTPSQTPNIPWCYIDKTRTSYTLQQSVNTVTGTERLRKEYMAIKYDTLSLFGEDINRLKITTELKGSNMLRIKIDDNDRPRFEVPVKTTWSDPVTQEEGILSNNDLNPRIESDGFGRLVIEVYRKSTGVRLFSTREYAESLVYSDQYIHLYARLATENVYGFGESTHETFRHRFTSNALTFPIWARDEPPLGGNKALYGTQPFYMCIEQDGSAHALLILNSNAQEYRFSSKKTFMYRTLGGILDIYMFSGPTPESVIQQYSRLIGRPMMPPYYALGFQLSRYGYNTLDNMKGAISRTVNAGIPLDIQHGDIDHFERKKDFTYDKVNFAGFPEYINELKSKGIRFIPIVDPALVTNEPNYMPYVRGMQQDVWIKWPQDINPQAGETVNRNMLGYVWPEGKVLFPDFFHNKTIQWWADEIKNYYQSTLKFDGLWIDMNEPANFGTNLNKPFNWPDNLPPWSLKCPNNRYDDPPYRTNAAFGARLSDKTLCLCAEQTDGLVLYRQYDVHNLYGYTQTLATYEALLQARPNKRPLVITRSTFPGSGQRSGHWLGDNASGWKHLKYNIIGLLEFNLFLIPYVGADICGFFDDATDELCERWMQLGAFNPFYRNHNGLYGTNQDPAAFNPTVTASMKKTVLLRYTLIPYLYTLFYRVHTQGGTVVRSLVHEFPTDRRAYDIDEQFLWGSNLLISPVITQGRTTVNVYIPPEARWFDYYNGKEIDFKTTVLPAPRDFIPLHVRGGAILPIQEPGINTDASRKNPFGIIIAPDEADQARGELYWDDGESNDSISSQKFTLIEFVYSHANVESIIEMNIKTAGYTINNKLNKIRLFDVKLRPTGFLIDSIQQQGVVFAYDSLDLSLEIQNLNLSMDNNHKIIIQY
ncbi:unnamed protein product [Brachionus calyciflorus]|uniref:alpha-glucosidase n=1 Tax=Brachionus calyciflorus TaxID=104777 RepID=A0A813MD79_9BILA|nr:unnamed protein product [Brachionus calyciflorus]